ncbi:MAG: hypothetical protein Q7V05_09615 [Methanoregula sp.]|nr:hypothetical protein [Methanoregula sp.]
MKFLFQDPLGIFPTRSAQKFSIKVRLKIFRQGLIYRYAASTQGLRGRLKFSGQGLMYFFQPGSARNFSIKVRLKIFKQDLFIISGPDPTRPRCGPGAARSRLAVQPGAGERGAFGNGRDMKGHRNLHVPEHWECERFWKRLGYSETGKKGRFPGSAKVWELTRSSVTVLLAAGYERERGSLIFQSIHTAKYRSAG